MSRYLRFSAILSIVFVTLHLSGIVTPTKVDVVLIYLGILAQAILYVIHRREQRAETP